MGNKSYVQHDSKLKQKYQNYDCWQWMQNADSVMLDNSQASLCTPVCVCVCVCVQLSEVSSTDNPSSELTTVAYVCRVHLDVLHCSVHVEGCGFASQEYNSNGL